MKSIEQLATRLDNFYRDYDLYEYQDTEGNVNDALQLLKEDPLTVINDLLEILEEMTP